MLVQVFKVFLNLHHFHVNLNIFIMDQLAQLIFLHLLYLIFFHHEQRLNKLNQINNKFMIQKQINQLQCKLQDRKHKFLYQLLQQILVFLKYHHIKYLNIQDFIFFHLHLFLLHLHHHRHHHFMKHLLHQVLKGQLLMQHQLVVLEHQVILGMDQ